MTIMGQRMALSSAEGKDADLDDEKVG